MKNTLSTLIRIVLVLIAAITLALLSVRIERIGPDLVQYSNLCEPANMDLCYKPALKGGFPVPYLVDAPGISVQRQLAFFEDNLHPWALTADIALYFAILMSIVWAVRRRRSK